jgi:formate dehydrogenase subunit delta
MSAASPERLVHMVNQIARFFASQPGEAASATADHLRAFWAPAMRKTIIAWVEAGGGGLDPVAAGAVMLLRRAASGEAHGDAAP